MSVFQKNPNDDDGFLDPINMEEKYPPLDPLLNKPLNQQLETNLVEELETSFLQSNLFDVNKKEGKKEEDYLSSEYRKNKYKNITQKDVEFNKYLRGIYGSAENYLEMNNFLIENKIYDPTSDYLAEVEIITKDSFYKSSFISQTETVLELIDGVCTIDYFQKNGSIDRLVVSLSGAHVPQNELRTRLSAFAGLQGERVLVWNIVKKGWSSFYMSNMTRFIRDDTSDVR
jgi:hypothetical protein